MVSLPAVVTIVAPVARNVEEHLSAMFRVSLTIEDSSVAEAVERLLPPDGQWDGRVISSRDGGAISRVLTDPLIARLEGIETGSVVHAWVDEADVLQLASMPLDVGGPPSS